MSVSLQRRVVFDAATAKGRRKAAFKAQHSLSEWAALQRTRAEERVDAIVAEIFAAQRRVEAGRRKRLEKHTKTTTSTPSSVGGAPSASSAAVALPASIAANNKAEEGVADASPASIAATDAPPLVADERTVSAASATAAALPSNGQSRVSSPLIQAAAEAAAAVGYQQGLQQALQLSPSKLALMRADSAEQSLHQSLSMGESVAETSQQRQAPTAIAVPALINNAATPATAAATPAANNNSNNNSANAAAAATALSTFELQVRMDPYRTGFEEERELPIIAGTVIAGRYQIIDLLGQATFSRAVRCVDLQQRYVYDEAKGDYAVKLLRAPDAPLKRVDGTLEEDLHEDTDADEDEFEEDTEESTCSDESSDSSSSSDAGSDHHDDDVSGIETSNGNKMASSLRKEPKKGKKNKATAAGVGISKNNRRLFAMVAAAGGLPSGLVDSDVDEEEDGEGNVSSSAKAGASNKKAKRKNKKKNSDDVDDDASAAPEGDGGQQKTRSADTYVQVCLKIINNSKEFFDQSLDEIRLLHLLNSRGNPDAQHFVRMYHFFYHREHTFIVTELLSDNLYEYGKYVRDHRLPAYYTVPRLRSIARQILTALSFCHSMNLVHCDLKPENILFVSHSRCIIKVIDFGSSCFLSDHLSSYVQSRSYRAPEVILGADYDGRIDVWSLGAILVELVTQQVLFQSETAAEMLARIVAVCGKPLPRSLLYEGRATANFVDRFGCIYEVGEKGGDPGAEDCYYLYTPVHTAPLRADTAVLAAAASKNKEGGEESAANPNPKSLAATEIVARTAGTRILAAAVASSEAATTQQQKKVASPFHGSSTNSLPMARAFPVEPYAALRAKLAREGVNPRGLFADFVIQCLDLDHRRRPTSHELLNHPFLAQPDDDEDLSDGEGGGGGYYGDDDASYLRQHQQKRGAGDGLDDSHFALSGASDAYEVPSGAGFDDSRQYGHDDEDEEEDIIGDDDDDEEEDPYSRIRRLRRQQQEEEEAMRRGGRGAGDEDEDGFDDDEEGDHHHRYYRSGEEEAEEEEGEEYYHAYHHEEAEEGEEEEEGHHRYGRHQMFNQSHRPRRYGGEEEAEEYRTCDGDSPSAGGGYDGDDYAYDHYDEEAEEAEEDGVSRALQFTTGGDELRDDEGAEEGEE